VRHPVSRGQSVRSRAPDTNRLERSVPTALTARGGGEPDVPTAVPSYGLWERSVPNGTGRAASAASGTQVAAPATAGVPDSGGTVRAARNGTHAEGASGAVGATGVGVAAVGSISGPASGRRVGTVVTRERTAPGPAALSTGVGQRRERGLAADVMALGAAAVAAAAVESAGRGHLGSGPFDPHLVRTVFRLGLCVPVLAAVLSGTRSAASTLVRTTFGQQVHAVALPLGAGGLLCLAAWLVAAGAGITPLSPDGVVLLSGIGILAVAGARVARWRLPRGGSRRTTRVLVVGSGRVARQVADRLHADRGVEVVGFVDDDPAEDAGWLGPLCLLPVLCGELHVDHLVVAFSRSAPEAIVEALRPLQGRLPIAVVPRLFDLVPATASVHDLAAGIPAVGVGPASRGPLPRALKRTVDLVAAGAGLAVLAPVLVLVALAIRATSRGPALVRQTRIGRDGQPFSMLKFRTMRVGHALGHPAAGEDGLAAGPFPKRKHDPRVTPLGRVLRRTSLDELPQLLAVVRGDMSLVGPRPFLPEDAAAIDGWAARRYAMRPGLTGLWQVSGRNDLTFEEMCRLDNLYVSCWSVGLDLRILIRTIRVVVSGRGAY